MKHIVAILLFLITSKGVPAQTTIEVNYHIVFNQQFDRPARDMRELNGKLYISNNKQAVFFMLPLYPFKGNTEEEIEIQEDTIWRVFADIEKNSLVFEDLFYSNLKKTLYADTLYPMHWEISSETRLFDSLQCTKAVTVFRGRSYTAWFCPSIPISFGPWKMGALPGLIIDLRDDADNLTITLSRIRPSSYHFSMPPLPAKTFADYIALGKKIRKLLIASARTNTNEPDCTDCSSQSGVSFRAWEKVFD